MRTLKRLYREAERAHIQICGFHSPLKKSYSVKLDSHYYVAVDYSKIRNTYEEKKVIAEEVSHCEEGLLYRIADIFNPLHMQNVSKCENLARRAAVKKIVPLSELKQLLRNGTCYEDIAETLNVLPCDIAEAIRIYQIENKLSAYIFLSE